MTDLSRREFLQTTAGAAGVAALGGCSTARGQASAEPPNLLFVFGDQWRRHALGFMNEDPVLTPHIDHFAQESLVFTDAVTACPLCSPYRATLLSGRYPVSTGVVTNNILLDPAERCIGNVLQDNGYRTGYIGKWHLDGEPWNHFTPPGPRRQGFEYWHANGCHHHHFSIHYWEDDPEPITGVGWQPDHETDVAIRYIENRDKTKPFALFVSWAPPHTIHGGPGFDGPEGGRFQYAAPERFERLYRGKDLPRRPNVPGDFAKDALPGYFGAVTSLDECLGRLIACLEEQGIADNTIVVLTADHGEMLGSHGNMTKGPSYEESIGIPFIIRWPGRIPARHDDLLLNSVDVMPSLLGLMGAAIPDNVEGRDYASIMRGEDGERPSSAYIGFYSKDMQGGWRGIRTHRYTYVIPRGDQDLFETRVDNIADPYQMNPVHRSLANGTAFPEQFEELYTWMQQTNDPWTKELRG